uniref:Uncharacterized protein MANES_02G155100 n=1 Tax=Rhizophora mucronata TaxID=61149 RepID=A0A2P2KWM0_RHIMU
MMLGKRPRPPMARTTSMSEIKFDLNTDSEEAPPSAESPHLISQNYVGFSGNHPDQWLPAAATAVASPRGHRRASADFSETAHFLRSCFLCKRRLVPSRDIYMYRYFWFVSHSLQSFYI